MYIYPIGDESMNDNLLTHFYAFTVCLCIEPIFGDLLCTDAI